MLTNPRDAFRGQSRSPYTDGSSLMRWLNCNTTSTGWRVLQFSRAIRPFDDLRQKIHIFFFRSCRPRVIVTIEGLFTGLGCLYGLLCWGAVSQWCCRTNTIRPQWPLMRYITVTVRQRTVSRCRFTVKSYRSCNHRVTRIHQSESLSISWVTLKNWTSRTWPNIPDDINRPTLQLC